MTEKYITKLVEKQKSNNENVSNKNCIESKKKIKVNNINEIFEKLSTEELEFITESLELKTDIYDTFFEYSR